MSLYKRIHDTATWLIWWCVWENTRYRYVVCLENIRYRYVADMMVCLGEYTIPLRGVSGIIHDTATWLIWWCVWGNTRYRYMVCLGEYTIPLHGVSGGIHDTATWCVWDNTRYRYVVCLGDYTIPLRGVSGIIHDTATWCVWENTRYRYVADMMVCLGEYTIPLRGWYDGASGEYTIPLRGWYDGVSGRIHDTATWCVWGNTRYRYVADMMVCLGEYTIPLRGWYDGVSGEIHDTATWLIWWCVWGNTRYRYVADMMSLIVIVPGESVSYIYWHITLLRQTPRVEVMIRWQTIVYTSIYIYRDYSTNHVYLHRFSRLWFCVWV